MDTIWIDQPGMFVYMVTHDSLILSRYSLAWLRDLYLQPERIMLGPREVSHQSYISTALLASFNHPVALQMIVIGNGPFYDVSQSTNIATVA